jgi:hypothetical protein
MTKPIMIGLALLALAGCSVHHVPFRAGVNIETAPAPPPPPPCPPSSRYAVPPCGK